MLVTIGVFLLVLSILVLIHEAGHFFVAKKLGVKVEEFGFGFPPRIFGKRYGETLYSINLLPIGGFVKLFGEDEAGGGKLGSVTDAALHAKGKNLKRAFYARPVWQRASIVLAGVVMNFLLAVVIISYLFAVQGVPVASNHVIVQAVSPGSPADKVGIKPDDAIMSIDGMHVSTPQQLITITKEHLGEQLTIQVQNPRNQIQVIFVTPRIKYPKNEGAMGIAIANVTVKRYPWYQAPYVGTIESFKESWMIVQGLGDAIFQAAVHKTVPKGLAGPVGIAQLTGETVQIGFNAVLSLVSLLSLNLAVLNILPIPALDGGRLFFIVLEGITRKKVNPKIEGYAHAVGMVLLLTLILVLTFHDIIRIFTHQPLLP